MAKVPLYSFFLFNNATQHFTELSSGFTCGRTSGDYQFPSDDLVSKLQCRFQIKGNHVFVEDLGATNPTRVNSVPLTSRRPRKLHLNDVIEFGHCYLILTNQKSRLPANIRDRSEKAVQRAVKRRNGVLSSNLTGSRSFTKTLVRLSERSYRILKLKEFPQIRTWDASTSLTGATVFLCWIAALYFAYKQGAFGALSSISELLLVGEQLFIGLVLSVAFTFLHSFFVRRSVGSRFRRLLFIPLWIAMGGLAVTFSAFMTNVFAVPEMNIVRRHCVDQFQLNLCERLANNHFPGFSALTSEERRHIRDRIEDSLERKKQRLR